MPKSLGYAFACALVTFAQIVSRKAFSVRNDDVEGAPLDVAMVSIGLLLIIGYALSGTDRSTILKIYNGKGIWFLFIAASTWAASFTFYFIALKQKDLGWGPVAAVVDTYVIMLFG